MVTPKKIRIPLLCLGLGVLGALGVAAASGQPDKDSSNLQPQDAVYTWTKPTFGPPVATYKVEILVNDLDLRVMEGITTTRVTIPVAYGNKYLVRVAGVDADGKVGIFSPWSEAYTPELAPPGF